jgi:hypothetical protein
MEYIKTLVNDTYTTGWHSLLVEVNDDGMVVNITLWFNHDPTIPELQTAVTNYGVATQYDKFQSLNFGIEEDKPLLKSFVLYVKARPTMTLTQFNTLMGTMAWYEAAIIRFFTYMIARGLAQKYGVDLGDYKESTVWIKVRDWIVATALKKIAKIFFGNQNEM